RRDTVVTSDTTGISIPATEKYSDYRPVGGLMLPFMTTTTTPTTGDAVIRVREVKFDVEVPASAFRPPAKKRGA
ncbi:MAG: hypothetical protein ACRD68_07550, partial [Pyrinomonadaceae bacterium]